MASPDNSKSISSSHSIPFSKPSRDAFEDMTAFTPPVESWIIKYPKKEHQDSRKPRRVPKEEELEDPCRKYIESSEIPIKSNKSLGTDDHFKSAVCSKNLLKACEKIMSTKDFSKHPMEDGDEFDAELSLMNENSRMEYYRQKHSARRGSQSLPASPKLERKQTPEPKVYLKVDGIDFLEFELGVA
ncbi:CLUMA_CG005022, isoform A [Clunio marinus]|uniref:CLUMA_CG005022, isoform A n=1 Tax=Clunio marinus TaxID=568069 RepID=A0A1J1HTM7_9DIPT|nr:CLUMA_CG005022, isoform A [Clunio marinus]